MRSTLAGPAGAVAEQQAEEPGGGLVGAQDVPVAVHHHRRERLLLAEDGVERATNRGQLGCVQGRLPVHGGEPGRQQKRVALAQRHVQHARQQQHHLAARGSPVPSRRTKGAGARPPPRWPARAGSRRRALRQYCSSAPMEAAEAAGDPACVMPGIIAGPLRRGTRARPGGIRRHVGRETLLLHAVGDDLHERRPVGLGDPQAFVHRRHRASDVGAGAARLLADELHHQLELALLAVFSVASEHVAEVGVLSDAGKNQRDSRDAVVPTQPFVESGARGGRPRLVRGEGGGDDGDRQHRGEHRRRVRHAEVRRFLLMAIILFSLRP